MSITYRDYFSSMPLKDMGKLEALLATVTWLGIIRITVAASVIVVELLDGGITAHS